MRAPKLRDDCAESRSPFALPVLHLVAAVKADPRWRDRAAAVEEAQEWTRLTAGPPRPCHEIPRADRCAGIGAYGRWLEARRQAASARQQTEAATPARIDAEAPGEVAERRKALPTTDSSSDEINALGTSPDFPRKSTHKTHSKFSPHKRQLGGRKIIAAAAKRRAGKAAA